MIRISAILAILIFTSCKKDGYLTDGGTANPISAYSTYDYLANHKDHYFDTVLLIVDHLGLKDSLNSSGTFFAPTDFSITRLMTTLGVSSLDSLYGHITSKFLTQYMFSDTAITLNNATIAAVPHENWADTISAVKKISVTYSASSSTFTYFVLQYVKINGALDGAAGTPAGDPVDAVMNCQTSGIKTAGGTTLHVLSNIASLAIK
jgi:hypothetical protein